MSQPLTARNEPELMISVPRAAKRVGIGTSLAYQLIQEGKFPHKRVGRRLLVPTKALEEFCKPDC